jgi:hypothetical protein
LTVAIPEQKVIISQWSFFDFANRILKPFPSRQESDFFTRGAALECTSFESLNITVALTGP